MIDPASFPSPGDATAPRLMMALSGGVDSAVALMLLKRQGYAVEALFMKNWEEDDADGYCAAAEDLADAERVCERLDVTLHTVNFSFEYWENVFTHFLDEYRSGRTPNPDVLCNREVKFQAFAEHAATLGAGRIATGHYARVERDGDRFRLLTGRDPEKDQSYFLHMLDQRQLARAVFPIGDRSKRDVRRMAREAGLVTHDKKDSTGICFIGERPFREFLARFLEARAGPIESVDGERLGEHQGLALYTIGQRQGLGIGGRVGSSGAPWYVVEKDLASNTLIVAQGRDHAALYARELVAGAPHWIRGEAPVMPLRCEAKIRYRQPAAPCRVSGDDAGCRVRFDAPQWAAAPGQSVVFYCGDECLGGAVIDDVHL